MPKPGFKTVTIKEELLEKVDEFLGTGYKGTADFVSLAIREKLDRESRKVKIPRE